VCGLRLPVRAAAQRCPATLLLQAGLSAHAPASLAASGLGSSSAAKEAAKIAFDYFKANISRVSGLAKAGDHDYHLHTVELHNTGPTRTMTLPSFVALCSGIMQKSVQSQLVVLGDMSLGGSVIPVENLAECLQVAFDSGTKRVLLPMQASAISQAFQGNSLPSSRRLSMQILWTRCSRHWVWSRNTRYPLGDLSLTGHHY